MHRPIVPAACLALAATACFLHPRRDESSRSGTTDIVLGDSMIAASGAHTAWEAIKRLVPQINYRENNQGEPVRAWRRGRGSLLLDESPLVIVDGVRMAELRSLEQIPAGSVREIRILSGISGTTYYGTNATSGVIVVETHGSP